MSRVAMEDLPDSARVWIFGADRSPSPNETAHLLDAVARFVEDWTAHAEDLRAAVDWRHHRFLLVGLDESRAAASGCSIDALMGRLRELGSELDLELTDGRPVWFRDPEGRVRQVSRDAFRRLSRGGEVDGETTVFDLTVDRLGHVREDRWVRPAADSWHEALLEEAAGEASEHSSAP